MGLEQELVESEISLGCAILEKVRLGGALLGHRGQRREEAREGAHVRRILDGRSIIGRRGGGNPAKRGQHILVLLCCTELLSLLDAKEGDRTVGMADGEDLAVGSPR